MTDTVQYVADRIELMDVMLKYARGCDERDLTLYRSVFADDAVITGFGPEAFPGADAWTAYVEEALKAFGPTQHMMGPLLATIDGDTAECFTNVQALHFLSDKPDTTLTLWATYETTMKRIDGSWKIARHNLVRRGVRTQAD